MRAESRAVASLRRSAARSVSISSITLAELLYSAHLREDNRPSWRLFAPFLREYRFIGGMRKPLRCMPGMGSRPSASVAAHAHALGLTLVTNDAAIKTLRIEGLKVVSW